LPPVDPFVIGWNYPLMEVRDDLDAEKMKRAKPGKKKEHDPVELMEAIRDTTEANPVSISAWARGLGINPNTLRDYTTGLRSKGFIKTVGEGTSARQYLTEKGRQELQ
jgi:predicted transcriptional regulator